MTLLMRRRGQSSPWATTVGATLLVVGLLLAPLAFINPPASAQGTPVVSIDDVIVADENGTFVATISLATNGTPITGLHIALTYDPAMIQPVLNTNPFDGTIGAPQCTRLSGVAGACGPADPSGTVAVSMFRTTGAWQGELDLVQVAFVAQGVPGVSPITIASNEFSDLVSVTIPGTAIDGSATIGTGMTAATPTPIPGSADLSISKSVGVSEPVPSGSTFDYTITGLNSGPDTAIDVVLTDTIPPGILLPIPPEADGWDCTISVQTFNCSNASLAVGQTFEFSYQVEPDGLVQTGVPLANEVSISATTTDPDETNNVASASVTIATPTPTPTPQATPTPTPSVLSVGADPSPTSPPLPTAEPALPYPGPINNAPPSQTAGSYGFAIQPSMQSEVLPAAIEASTDASNGAIDGSSTDAGSDSSAVLALTGAQTPVMATISLSLITLGGFMLVTSRRKEDQAN